MVKNRAIEVRKYDTAAVVHASVLSDSDCISRIATRARRAILHPDVTHQGSPLIARAMRKNRDRKPGRHVFGRAIVDMTFIM